MTLTSIVLSCGGLWLLHRLFRKYIEMSKINEEREQGIERAHNALIASRRFKKLKPNEVSDVYCQKVEGAIQHRFDTNLPTLGTDPHDHEICWGYSGQGPWTFAVGILEHFAPKEPLFDNKRTRNRFIARFIAPLPQPPNGAVISANEILDWIKDEKLRRAEELKLMGEKADA